MPPNLRVLVVDDCEDDAVLVIHRIRKGGYEVDFERVDTAEAMAAALVRRSWDIIVSDVNMPSFSAAAALAMYKEHELDCPFIVVSGVIGEETAVGLLKSGAHDFVLKTNLARLVPAIERETADWEVRRARLDAEEALRRSEERYALAARGSNDGLWDWDLLDDRIYFSPRWKEMLGFGDDEIGGQPGEWFDRVHEDDAEAVRKALAAHLRGETPHFIIEHRMRNRSGDLRWMVARGLAVRGRDGRPCRIAGSFSDVTSDKIAAQQLREAKDELESALAAKTRFLAAASHDLRQPVQALLCFAAVLEGKLVGQPASKIVEELYISLGGLKCLLDSLLDVSKLDAGMVSAVVQPIRLASVVNQVATEMRPVASQKGLELRVVCPDVAVRSDSVLLTRIVRNLVENAIRYTDEGRILIGCRRRGDEISLGVWDTGIGIAEHMRGQIFEEFFQVGNSERDRRKGLGLGLAIVQRLARLLDHPVTVGSQLGQGSYFGLTMPWVAEAMVPPPPPVMTPEGAGCGVGLGTVLVIDDEFVVAKATAALVSAWGYDAIAAGSIAEALSLLPNPRSCLPCLIVADYRLQDGETGLDAIRRICSHCDKQIPSIVITGDTAPDRMRDVEGSGLTMLHKPVDPRELRQALADAARAKPRQALV